MEIEIVINDKRYVVLTTQNASSGVKFLCKSSRDHFRNIQHPLKMPMLNIVYTIYSPALPSSVCTIVNGQMPGNSLPGSLVRPLN